MHTPDEQFHLLVDAVKDYAIFMLDPKGVVTTWNPGAQRINGYAPEEIIGRHFSIFYTEQDRGAGAPEHGLQAARKQGRYAAEAVRVRKDGSRYNADVLITPVYKDGDGLIGYAKVTRDVTARHKLEEQLRERVDLLAEAEKRKDEYIAMLAHELRNPLSPVLTGMTGMTIVQRTSPHSAAGQRALHAMERQLKLMSRMVDDLLQISRINLGKIELRRGWVQLHELVEHAVELVEPVSTSREQILGVDCEQGVAIYCDAQRVVQALSNIINNATKYTPQGGRIEVTGVRSEGEARITVKDNGIGIRKEMLDRIFEVFTQDQQPSGGTEMQSGLGIGLALARSIVAMHGGSIRAQSEGPGRGSQFDVLLPLRAVGEHEADPVTSKKELRILVVDDNRDAANMIGDLLEVEGYVVQRAYGGLEALRKAEEMHPHMILLDLLMPDITGYEIIKRVRRHPGGPVVVAVTGYGSEQDRESVRQAGFDEHIVKPVAGEAILGVVRRFLPQPKAAPAPAPAPAK